MEDPLKELRAVLEFIRKHGAMFEAYQVFLALKLLDLAAADTAMLQARVAKLEAALQAFLAVCGDDIAGCGCANCGAARALRDALFVDEGVVG